MRRLFLFGAVSALLVSCRAEVPAGPEVVSVVDVPLVEMRLTALPTHQKTVITDGAAVHWQAGDQIVVMDGYGLRQFTTKNGGASAVFEGSAAEVAGLVMAYPYSILTSRSGDEVTMTLSGKQVATPGTFQRGANVTLAKINSDGSFLARNLCALVCLEIGRTDVTSVELRSLSGSALAGRVRVAFDGEGVPYVAQALEGSATVTLTPQGDVITPGKYWVPVLPGLFESGLEVRLNLVGGVVARKVVGTGLNLPRSAYLEVDADSDLAFEKDEKRIVVIYGDSITHINVFDYLQQLLDTKACDRMDADTLKHISYRVVMAGRSGERPLQIVCRQGGLPLYIKGAFTLNRVAGAYSDIGCGFYTTMDENAVPLDTPGQLVNVDLGGESTTGWTGCTNPFVLDGISCTIRKTADEGSPSGQYNQITRNASGESDREFGGEYSLVRTHVDMEYGKPYISTVYMGTNGKYIYEKPTDDGHSWAQLGDFVQLMMDHSPSTKWIVCGYHSKSRWTQGGTDYMAGRFGDKYIDLKKEGIRKVSTINSRISYTLTELDNQYLLDDQWPAGWQDLSNPIHPSPVGHKAYATLLFEKMEELGYL